MIVKDETTMAQAMDLIKTGPVRYSDHNRFAIVENPAELMAWCKGQLRCDDIAIVVARGRESFMEDYDYNVKLIRKARAIEERKAVRAWVTAHPKEARRIMERQEQIDQAQRMASVV